MESFVLSPGNISDCTAFNFLHDRVNNDFIQYVIADKGYDSDKIRMKIKEKGREPIIPYRSNRLEPKEIDKEIYKTRNIVERMFGRVKENRRVATRYDKLDITFSAFIALAFLQQILC